MAGSKKGDYSDLIRAAAAKYRIPEALLAAVIQVESSGDPKAVSPKGAKGLGQLMPATAAALGVTDPFDPVQNVSASAQLLSTLLTKYGGNVALALAAYNAGEPAVDRVQGVPNIPETINYVKKVAQIINQPARRARPTTTPYPNAMTRPVAPVPEPRPRDELFSGGLPGQPTSLKADRDSGFPTGLGGISNMQMEEVLRQIAAENAQVPLDMSRQYEELQSGDYGPYQGASGGGGGGSASPPEYAGVPSIASLYSGGTFPQPEPSGLGALSRLFRPSGGRTFADDIPSER